MAMRLLLVEDDQDLSSFIKEGLTREGFAVTHVADGREAVALVGERPFDAVVMDVMMPKLDGVSALKQLRLHGFKGAVLLVTSKGLEQDKLKGFSSGADDYLVKPFLMTELVARIRAVVRRTKGAEEKEVQGSVLKVGILQMDLMRREVKRSGKAIVLTKREFDLLECFMRRPGQVLSQTVLNQHLSDQDFNAGTNVIEVHVKNLRAKLDGNAETSLIRTVRGCGYALDA